MKGRAKRHRSKVYCSRWVRRVFTLSLIALLLPWGERYSIQPVVAQSSNLGASCAAVKNPLTPEEEGHARIAWQYFQNNYQPQTGLVNAVNNYPSGTLWDLGNYLMALNAARWMDLIDQNEFDNRLNLFLTTMGQLRLFEDTLPNKVYNTSNGELVDYGNNPLERGMGWSALDIGRLLAAFHVIRTCHPQYDDWIKGVLEGWAIEKSIKNEQLYGAMVLPDGQTLPVQEGRLGYEEYAARGYELWGYKVPKAIALEPYQSVDIYGVKIPVDARNFQDTNANNYVVSESYILDGIEFGFQGQLKAIATRILEVQRRRYEATGQLTAVTEDNIDQAPYFLYNTIYSNGVPWATITEANEAYPELRSISTKATFGWRYLFPESDYARKLFEVGKTLVSPDGGGFYAGQYEVTKQPNATLTGNTNGLIMEILYYKARGNRPLIGRNTFGDNTVDDHASGDHASGDHASALSTSIPSSPESESKILSDVIPIPPRALPREQSSQTLNRKLSVAERRYADAAWQYFEVNYNSETGLVRDRSDMNGTTLWGMGDYLAALQSALALDIISPDTFDQRVRLLIGALGQLPLFAGELPHRGYHVQTLDPVDYGTNLTSEGTGWSGLDVGRLLIALHDLKQTFPQYGNAIDQVLLDWSYLRVVRNGQIFNAMVTQDDRGRSLTRVFPAQDLGYEEYAARGFQLWGFDVQQSAVGREYQTVELEGQSIPIQRLHHPHSKDKKAPYITSEPFLRYGLEVGFDPIMRSHSNAILEAQAQRYQNDGILTASGTSVLQQAPYVMHSTLVAAKKPWAMITDTGEESSVPRIVSTATAFAYRALFPDHEYAQELGQSTVDLYNSSLGYYEGFFEPTGKSALGLSSGTNSIILQSLRYALSSQKPLLTPATSHRSPWWKAIAKGNSGNGLPQAKSPTATLIQNTAHAYWQTQNTVTSSDRENEVVPQASRPLEPMLRVNPMSVEATTSTVVQQPLVLNPLSALDRDAAERAWNYFERNWHPQTGLINAVESYPWTTLWDQGSAILGLHCAQALNLISPQQFTDRTDRLFKTLAQLPLPNTGLPNKAYSTRTGEMRQLNNQPDPQGISGWSVLDTARFLIALDIFQTAHPEYQDRIQSIVQRWQLSKLIHQGWLQGGMSTPGGIQLVQEGRLGYEQYAAHGLKSWGLDADNALNHAPTKPVDLEGIVLQVDQRNLKNSGASNYLTNDPYLLWGLELGWPPSVQPQVNNLLAVQKKRYQATGILTAPNEDSLDRFPHFLYYGVYANGQSWPALNSQGQAFQEFKFLSTKAAFAWDALMPKDAYAQMLRKTVQTLADPQRGVFCRKL